MTENENASFMVGTRACLFGLFHLVQQLSTKYADGVVYKIRIIKFQKRQQAVVFQIKQQNE